MKRHVAWILAVFGAGVLGVGVLGVGLPGIGVAMAAMGGGAAPHVAEDGDTPVILVAQITITDREEYAKYGAGFGEIFRKYGGQSVGFSESPEVLEGEWDYTRTVVIRFDSRDAARSWYYSPEYQELVKHRWAGSTANLVMIDGR